MGEQRIVSLIASATEIVCALGCESRLVGRSHECDYPESVRRLPVCTTPKFATDGTSYEVDQRVKALVQEGLSVYRVDGAKLRELRPTVIVTQSHCEVCAVSERVVQEAVCDWLEARPTIVSLAPNNLADVWNGILQVSDALSVPVNGRKLVERLSKRMQDIAAQASSVEHRPTIACIEWIEPLMACGNWMPELVAMAGGVNLFGEAGRHSPWMTWDQLQTADPDVLFIVPCGFDIAKTRQEVHHLTARAGWDTLRAVHQGHVCLADGNQYFNRPGPRLAESLEILAEVLHPERFAFGHQGTGWQWL